MIEPKSIPFLSENQRDYILEEVAVLHGCIPLGLLFTETENELKPPVFIVYPRELDGAFSEGKKLLQKHYSENKVSVLYDVQPLEIRISEDNELLDKTRSSIQHFIAYFAKQKSIDTLLQAKTKRLLFLISIGQNYHEGNYLTATINLFNTIIRGCVELINRENESKKSSISNTINFARQLDIAKGEWQIRVVVADTLQSYNETSKEQAILQYKEMGKLWASMAKPIFAQLETAGAGVVKVSPEFVTWNELLEKANKYTYQNKYDYLFKMYSLETSVFYKAVVDKGLKHKYRQLKKRLIDNNILHETKQAIEEEIKGINKIANELNIKIDTESTVENQSKNSDNTQEQKNRATPKDSLFAESKLLGSSNQLKATDANHLRKQYYFVKRMILGLNPDYACTSPEINGGKVNFPSLNEAYAIPREDLLCQLRTVFNEAPSANKLSIVVCCGVGGSGKSHLVNSYANLANDVYSKRIWLKAKTNEDLKISIRKLCQELNICDMSLKDIKPEELTQRMKDWFVQKENAGWLLILDDAIDYKSIENYLPQKGGHIIITSRQDAWSEPFLKVIKIEGMTQSDAIKLLIIHSTRQEPQFIKLANTLDRLPLALEIAGSFLKQHPLVTIEKYISDFNFNESINDDNSSSVAENSKKNAVTCSFLISIKNIREVDRQKKQVSLADGMLNICAYFANSNIPINLLKRWLNKNYFDQINIEPNLLFRLLNQLADYFLITVNYNLNNITIHNVLQNAIRSKKYQSDLQHAFHVNESKHQLQNNKTNNVESQKNNNYIVMAVDSLLEEYPFEKESAPDYALKILLHPHLEKILKHFTQYINGLINDIELCFRLDIELRVKLLRYLADCYNYVGDALRRKHLLEQELKIEEQRFGKEHIEVGKTLFHLSKACCELGEWATEKKLLARAFLIMEPYYGCHHAEVAKVMMSYTLVDCNLSYIRSRKRFLASPFSETFESLTKLSKLNTLRRVELLLHSTHVLAKHYGREHKEVINALIHSANARGDLNAEEARITFLEKALYLQEKLYGKDHVETIKIIGYLARSNTHYLSIIPIVKANEEWYKQYIILEHILPFIESHYGKSHIEVAKILIYLAIAKGKLDYLNEEKLLLERSLAILKAHYSENHPEIANVLFFYIVNCQRRGDTSVSESILRINSIYSAFSDYETPDSYQEKFNNYMVTGQFKMPSHISEQELYDNIRKYGADALLHSMVHKDSFPVENYQKNVLSSYFQKCLERKLRNAAANNQVDELKNIINRIKNINSQDDNPKSKKTALHWAVIKGHKGCVLLLLNANADVRIPDAKAMTALDYASADSNNSILDCMLNKPTKNPIILNKKFL